MARGKGRRPAETVEPGLPRQGPFGSSNGPGSRGRRGLGPSAYIQSFGFNQEFSLVYQNFILASKNQGAPARGTEGGGRSHQGRRTPRSCSAGAPPSR